MAAARWPAFIDQEDPEVGTLARLNNALQAAGWRGLGLWTHGGSFPTEQLAKLQAAGVRLLKLDGGDGACAVTVAARAAAPDLVVEHGDCGPGCPINEDGNTSQGRWPFASALAQARAANCSDLFRTYDMIKVLSIPAVLDRQAKLLLAANQLHLNGSGARLFGGSGEPAVTGALGGAVQPMRQDVRALAIPSLFAVAIGEGPHSRHRQHRLDQVERLVRWSRLAPP